MGFCHPVSQRAPSSDFTFQEYGATVKFCGQRGAGSYSKQKAPTDPIGVFALTLTNLAVGSAIQVESQSGVQLYNGTAGASTALINLQAYAAGSPLNNLRIKVRKGSASPYYQPWETLATAVVGAQSIYVSQIPDE